MRFRLFSPYTGYNIVFLIFGYSVSIGYTGVGRINNVNNVIICERVFRQQTPCSIHQGGRLKSKLILKPDLIFILCDLFYR